LKTESCKYRIEYRLSASLGDINIGYRKMAKTHIGTALLLAGLISHTARRPGLSACSGWVISCAGRAARAISLLKHVGSTVL